MCNHCLEDHYEVLGVNILGEDVCTNCGYVADDGELRHHIDWVTNQINLHNRNLEKEKFDDEENS